MIVREVEGIDRIGIGGRSRDIRVEEGRGVGPGRRDGGAVSVHRIAGDAAARRRPREGGACRGHAGGVEAGRGGGGTGGVLGTGWKTAHTAYQPSAAPRVAVPCWAPAALDVMSSSNAEPLEVCARGVYGTPALLPGVTEPGAPPVSKAANTSSPAPTPAVAPVSTVVP